MTKSYHIRTWQMNDETQTTLTASLGSMPQLNPHFQYSLSFNYSRLGTFIQFLAVEISLCIC